MDDISRNRNKSKNEKEEKCIFTGVDRPAPKSYADYDYLIKNSDDYGSWDNNMTKRGGRVQC